MFSKSESCEASSGRVTVEIKWYQSERNGSNILEKDISVLNFLGVDRINSPPEVGGGLELPRSVAGLQRPSLSILVTETFAGLGVHALDTAASKDLKCPGGRRETGAVVLISSCSLDRWGGPGGPGGRPRTLSWFPVAPRP